MAEQCASRCVADGAFQAAPPESGRLDSSLECAAGGRCADHRGSVGTLNLSEVAVSAGNDADPHQIIHTPSRGGFWSFCFK